MSRPYRKKKRVRPPKKKGPRVVEEIDLREVSLGPDGRAEIGGRIVRERPDPATVVRCEAPACMNLVPLRPDTVNPRCAKHAPPPTTVNLRI